jgi:thiol-disulfide isomerase/thioredoxin
LRSLPRHLGPKQQSFTILLPPHFSETHFFFIMKNTLKYWGACALLLAFAACQSAETPNGQAEATGTEAPAERKIVQFDEIEALMARTDGQVQVINFWATWCGPCVKELPYFEQARKRLAPKGVNFTLVSLDFASEYESGVLPFVEKKGVGSHVWLLNNTDYDSWIDRIDPEWEGEIPVTLVVNAKAKARHFVIGSITEAQIDSLVQLCMAP